MLINLATKIYSTSQCDSLERNVTAYRAVTACECLLHGDSQCAREPFFRPSIREENCILDVWWFLVCCFCLRVGEMPVVSTK